MRKWLEKLQAKLRTPDGAEVGNALPVPSTPGLDENQPSSGQTGDSLGQSADATNPTTMLEILKILSRIEYGLDEQELAEALAITVDAALANCEALEQEMFVHHHDELAKWFIAQRGLQFLQLDEHRD